MKKEKTHSTRMRSFEKPAEKKPAGSSQFTTDRHSKNITEKALLKNTRKHRHGIDDLLL